MLILESVIPFGSSQHLPLQTTFVVRTDLLSIQTLLIVYSTSAPILEYVQPFRPVIAIVSVKSNLKLIDVANRIIRKLNQTD